jgi:NAD(P)-dependent dehydrogenase (short-subunit alcohol dehydrogenase family)
MSPSKLILITGASSGFGKMTVGLLLERGHTVIAGIRGGEQRLGQVFSEELKRYPGKLKAVDLHMEKAETFQRASEVVESLGGKLDVLINNAGYGLFGALEDSSHEQLRHLFEVNFFGPSFLIQKLLPYLRATRGRIINVGSIAGLATFPGYSFYCASKHSIDAMSEGLYYELKPFGVQVAIIEPGAFETNFNSSIVLTEGTLKPGSLYAKRTKALHDYQKNAKSRLDDPMKVAKLIIKLCEKNKIPLRNPIGKDAQLMVRFVRHLPLNFQAWLKDFIFRKEIYKD